MSLQKKSFRKGLRPLAGATEPRSISRIDTWLARFANLSQPLLLCLAVFGYFYTVVPVYQKEVLSEQIASKEIELARLQRAIDETGPTMRRLEGERGALEQRLERLNVEREGSERKIVELGRRQSLLEARNAELDAARTKLAEQVTSVGANAKAFSLRAYHDSFASSVMMQYLGGIHDPYEIVESPTYEAISKYLVTPHAAVSATLAQGDSKFIESASRVPREVKDEYHAQVRSALDARKDILSRPQDDVNALLFQIKDELARSAIDPTPGDRFNEQLYRAKRRLIEVLQESRKREWNRTQKFLSEIAPGATPAAPKER